MQGTLDYRLLPERAARIFAMVLPWIELALAGALILDVAIPIAGLVASLLLLCFTIAVIAKRADTPICPYTTISTIRIATNDFGALTVNDDVGAHLPRPDIFLTKQYTALPTALTFFCLSRQHLLDFKRYGAYPLTWTR